MGTRFVLLRCLGCWFVLLAILFGQAQAAQAIANAEVDAEAKKVLDIFGKYFAELQGFRVTANIVLDVEIQGKHQNQEFVQKLSAERPNKLAYSLESNPGGAGVVSDGSDLSIYVRAFRKYGVDKAPDTWESLLQNPLVLGVMSMGNGGAVTAALLDADPTRKLLDKMESVSYGGLVMLKGVPCHWLKAVGQQTDWQLWIDAGDRPLPRQFVPDLAKVFAQAAKQMKGKSPFENLKATNTIAFGDWDVNPKFAADAFVFHVPEGSTKVESLMEVFGRAGIESGPHPLLGKPAPEAKIELLDGGTLDLASSKDKQVVILDFWATWCGPCVQAMPIIEKVADKYKDQGVLLYAVNIKEQADEIRKFLDEAKLHVAVALDADGAMASAYGASAIPQTVLIGKDGSVQVVHVGLSPNLEEQLSKQLDALLAGADLAAKTLDAAKEKGQSPAAKDGQVIAAARIAATTNKMKQIGIALQNYHDAFKRFPAAVSMGTDGKTPHSWRVDLLPFLEKQDLHKRYKMDEPWDSEHNLQLVKEGADLFSIPGAESNTNSNCAFFLITGKGTTFDGDPKPTIRGIRDGTSNTVGLVEAKRTIPWTKPQDIEVDPNGPLPKLGGNFQTGFHVGFLDARVVFLPQDFDEAKLRAYFSKAGGETANRP